MRKQSPKYRIASSLQTAVKAEDGPLYLQTAGTSVNNLLSGHNLGDTCSSVRAVAGIQDVVNRPGFNRHDRNDARPDDRLPTKQADIVTACQGLYKRIGIVRNVIDLMADFATDGLSIQHSSREQQAFYQEWARRTKLKDRAHDFAKYLLRDANVVVRRKYATLTPPAERQMSRGAEEEIVEKKLPKNRKSKRIPWQYIFISPAICEKAGGEAGRFVGSQVVSLKLPQKLIQSIRNPKTKEEKDAVAKLPEDILLAVRAGKKTIPLDTDSTHVSHYKKDDWDDWATPFLYAVMEDIMLKDKMRMADMAALDGVINVIRLWKLGNSDKGILPTKVAVNKLLGILENNYGGGVLDLVWDDMIDLKVEYPPTDKILGAEKYKSVNQDIVRGLGIPDALLSGGDANSRNAQAAFPQLKTMVERLEYVRGKVIEWLAEELRLVRDAMGWRNMPVISFSTMSLRDEAAEKQLLLNLLDRGIISVEAVLAVFGKDYMVEIERLREEQKLRTTESGLLERAGPFYRPVSVMQQQTDESIRLAKNSPPTGGTGTGGGENQAGDLPRKTQDGVPAGKPAGQKNTKPAPKTRTPRTYSAVYTALAGRFQDRIDTIFDPLYLASKGLKSIRAASAAQRSELEAVKRAALASLSPQDEPTEEVLKGILDRPATEASASCHRAYAALVEEHTKVFAKPPCVQDRRRLMAAAWTQVNTEEETDVAD